MRIFSLCLGILILGGSIFYGYLQYQRPLWETSITSLLSQAQETPLTSQSWSALGDQAQDQLPNFYPFSNIKTIINDIAILLQKIETPPQIVIKTDLKRIPQSTIEALHAYVDEIQADVKTLHTHVQGLPLSLIPPRFQASFSTVRERLDQVRTLSRDMDIFQQSLDRWYHDQSPILLILQNQHEPRSTGGFVGSLVLFNFDKEGLSWDFSDIYALDRQVPPQSGLKAPDFFKALSSSISLRDANFWPDFPISAEKYRYFFSIIDRPVPDTILALDLRVIEDLLEITGPIELEQWGIKASKDNFAIVLQFLVESKIAGRFATKAPVEVFAQSFLKKLIQSHPDPAILQDLLQKWIRNKDLLAHSHQPQLQKLIQDHNLDGKMDINPSTDHFLHFDFVSVGANKSEKFMWTKLHHHAQIDPNGLVLNTLNIKRTHALRSGELESFLELNTLPPNIQGLWNGELAWKLGYGENRTVLRVWVDKNAHLLTTHTPSGPINTASDPLLKDFQIWEIPLFILPGESLESEIRYTTRTLKGDQSWRPYTLQLEGTPGRDSQTQFQASVTAQDGTFGDLEGTLETPHPLQDLKLRFEARFTSP